MKNKERIIHILNEWESYASAGVFAIMTILLFAQVVGRYVFGHSWAWCEELSIALFVVQVYLAISAGVTHRRAVTVSVLVDALPFKSKRVLLVINSLVHLVFCVVLICGFKNLIYYLGNSTTPLLHIPYKYIYSTIPILQGLTIIRIIQNIWRLCHETEQELGHTVPPLDLDTPEREYLAEKAAKEAALKEGIN